LEEPAEEYVEVSTVSQPNEAEESLDNSKDGQRNLAGEEPNASGEEEPNSSGEEEPAMIVSQQGTSKKERLVKKIVPNPHNWKCNVQKRLKNSGKAYETRKKQLVSPKKMKPACNCKLNCSSKFDDAKRKVIFNDYWALADVQRQREFIHANMQTLVPKYRYIRDPACNNTADTTKDMKPRAKNEMFYFKDPQTESRIRVCKVFFRNTLGISDRTIRTVIEKRQKTPSTMTLEGEKRGKHGNNGKKISDAVKNAVRQHINSIPRLESHYCRKNTQRQFIEAGKTVADLHRNYVENQKTLRKPFVNYLMYNNIFKTEFNISFQTPKKDQCEDCIQYEGGNEKQKKEYEPSYQQHIFEKDASRNERENDLKTGDLTHVAAYDLQAVLPCPQGDASSFYYLSKLSVYNFTIYDMKKDVTSCYIWHEGEGKRGAVEIGTCVFKYIQALNDSATQPINIIFYSDNCSGQNKNYAMMNMYLFAVRNLPKIATITHKYLIKGHTQNISDTCHSMIEKKIKRIRQGGPLFHPEALISAIKSVTMKNKPFNVFVLGHKDFLDVESLSAVISADIIQISQVRNIKILKETVAVRYSYEQEFENPIPLPGPPILPKTTRSKDKGKKQEKDYLVSVYDEKIYIPKKKKEGLLTLFKKNLIPSFYLEFYSNL